MIGLGAWRRVVRVLTERKIMTRSIFAIAVCLLGLTAGCAPMDATGPSYRDTGQPLSVTTRHDTARLAGDWVLRAATPEEAALITVTYRPNAEQAFALTRRACTPSGACKTGQSLHSTTELGPNRWQIQTDQGPRQVWVIWVDENYRTAAIGAPDGRYAWILDRNATGGRDRVEAARTLLEFNGYDTNALIPR